MFYAKFLRPIKNINFQKNRNPGRIFFWFSEHKNCSLGPGQSPYTPIKHYSYFLNIALITDAMCALQCRILLALSQTNKWAPLSQVCSIFIIRKQRKMLIISLVDPFSGNEHQKIILISRYFFSENLNLGVIWGALTHQRYN